ncbi:FxsA family protein [Endozoicomonas sp. SCSIO W0465]|uniref:FxsA family protein n=1 Tax=Endozoicomonas sp. SCSIO W0465 TaxID=2918516 RepID=UPI002074FC25|nr:FxsA family protein [Endozoicomonas sp. SCSIO W0465]USE37564.1 FxsA family protein [Endozoicomonas sp. SCSIO W0465]
MGPLMRFLFLLFILLPILEMVVLIKVGSIIGAWNAVALVILSIFIGIEVIRRQGFRTMLSARQKMAAGETPAMEMLEHLALGLGGLLMLIPGFITDFMGIFLLIPPVRRLLIRRWLATCGVRVESANIYEAEYRREADDRKRSQIRQTLDGEFTREQDDHSSHR